MIARASWATPIVATSTITRARATSRRITASSTTAPARVPAATAQHERRPVRPARLPDHDREQRRGRDAEIGDGEVDDPARPVDEDDPHRDQRDDQPAHEPDEHQVRGPDVRHEEGADHQPPSEPKKTARARSSRSSRSLRRALEAHLTLLEEDRAVADLERDVERLLDDHHRLAPRLELLDDLEHPLHHDRRETERELVDDQHVGLAG